MNGKVGAQAHLLGFHCGAALRGALHLSASNSVQRELLRCIIGEDVTKKLCHPTLELEQHLPGPRTMPRRHNTHHQIVRLEYCSLSYTLTTCVR